MPPDHHLFRSRNLRRLAGLRDDFAQEESQRKPKPKRGLDFLDPLFFEEKIEEYRRMLAEAQAQDSYMTAHGSIREMQRRIELLEAWKGKYFEGSYADDFWEEVFRKDDVLNQIREEEDLQRYEDMKAHFRETGRGGATLIGDEQFDLPWLLECREKHLGLPATVQVPRGDDTFEDVPIDSYIDMLEQALANAEARADADVQQNYDEEEQSPQ